MIVRSLATMGQALREGKSICRDPLSLFVVHPPEHFQACGILHHWMAMLVEKEQPVKADSVPS